jgi:hypothetical protein
VFNKVANQVVEQVITVSPHRSDTLIVQQYLTADINRGQSRRDYQLQQ